MSLACLTKGFIFNILNHILWYNIKLSCFLEIFYAIYYIFLLHSKGKWMTKYYFLWDISELAISFVRIRGVYWRPKETRICSTHNGLSVLRFISRGKNLDTCTQQLDTENFEGIIWKLFGNHTFVTFMLTSSTESMLGNNFFSLEKTVENR